MHPSAAAWSPAQYLKFADERSRPARDLIAAIPLTEVRHAVDIGCGPGNSTELLVERFPEAKITGLDSSSEMLAAARKRLPHVAFVEADVATWRPQAPVDLLFANATFQWVPDHQQVLKRLFAALSSGGVLAVQMPDNVATEPSHTLMRAVAAEAPWAERFRDPIARETIGTPADYYNLLQGRRRVSTSGTRSTIIRWQAPGLSSRWCARPACAPIWRVSRRTNRRSSWRAIRRSWPRPIRRLPTASVLFRFPRLFIVAVRA